MYLKSFIHISLVIIVKKGQQVKQKVKCAGVWPWPFIFPLSIPVSKFLNCQAFWSKCMPLSLFLRKYRKGNFFLYLYVLTYQLMKFYNVRRKKVHALILKQQRLKFWKQVFNSSTRDEMIIVIIKRVLLLQYLTKTHRLAILRAVLRSLSREDWGVLGWDTTWLISRFSSSNTLSCFYQQQTDYCQHTTIGNTFFLKS